MTINRSLIQKIVSFFVIFRHKESLQFRKD